jgi:hypothetical protein
VLSAFPELDPLVQPTNLKRTAYAMLFAVSLPLELVFAKMKASGFMGFTLKKLVDEDFNKMVGKPSRVPA